MSAQKIVDGLQEALALEDAVLEVVKVVLRCNPNADKEKVLEGARALVYGDRARLRIRVPKAG